MLAALCSVHVRVSAPHETIGNYGLYIYIYIYIYIY